MLLDEILDGSLGLNAVEALLVVRVPAFDDTVLEESLDRRDVLLEARDKFGRRPVNCKEDAKVSRVTIAKNSSCT